MVNKQINYAPKLYVYYLLTHENIRNRFMDKRWNNSNLNNMKDFQACFKIVYFAKLQGLVLIKTIKTEKKLFSPIHLGGGVAKQNNYNKSYIIYNLLTSIYCTSVFLSNFLSFYVI